MLTQTLKYCINKRKTLTELHAEQIQNGGQGCKLG